MEVPLTRLSPAWIIHQSTGTLIRYGITFECPIDKNCAIGAYWTQPPDRKEKSLWKKIGSTFHTLTLSPSLDVTKKKPLSGQEPRREQCSFHGHIRSGMVIW